MEAELKNRFDSKVLNKSLLIFFKDAVKVAIKNPSQALSFLRTLHWLRKAARRRSHWKARGVPVPPIIIFSITNRCNLECKGCYALTFNQSSNDPISPTRLREIAQEAKEVGVSFFVIAGGEPFLRPELMDITKDYPEIIFMIFTNGTLIDEALLSQIERQKNVVPLISLEGDEKQTDERRGEGTFIFVKNLMEKMQRRNIFFGTSITLTRNNFETILNENYISDLVKTGCKFFLFLDYVPVQEGTNDLVLTDEQESRVPQLMATYRSRFPALFIAVPWDEMDVGGCLAAGRGFIHINANGDIEPCPFAPFSDENVQTASIKDVVQSPFLEALRQNPHLLTYTGGGCALWKNKEQVEQILKTISS